MSNTFVRVLTSVNTKQKKVNNFILHIFAKNLQVLSKNVQNKIDVGSYQHQFIYNIVHIHFCYNCVYLHGYCSFQFDYFNIFFSPLLSHLILSLPPFLFPLSFNSLSSPTLFLLYLLLNQASESIQIIKFFKLILNLDPKLFKHI